MQVHFIGSVPQRQRVRVQLGRLGTRARVICMFLFGVLCFFDGCVVSIVVGPCRSLSSVVFSRWQSLSVARRRSLAVGGCLLAVGWRRVAVGGWPSVVCRRRLAFGGWPSVCRFELVAVVDVCRDCRLPSWTVAAIVDCRRCRLPFAVRCRRLPSLSPLSPLSSLSRSSSLSPIALRESTVVRRCSS